VEIKEGSLRSEWGEPDDTKFPLGTFVNDYEYTIGTGDDHLDQCNGKVCYSPDLNQIILLLFHHGSFSIYSALLSRHANGEVAHEGITLAT